MRLLPARFRFANAAALPVQAGSTRRRRLWRVLIALPVLLLLVEVVHVLFAGNTHMVEPGKVYRSAQLSGDRLSDYIREKGIRTVVNLRGCNAPIDWYKDELQVAHSLNISQEDVTLSANRLPSMSELRRLVEVMDRSQYPIVLHCKQGADRTGLASALYLMMYTDTDYATARRQCGPRYAHLPLLSTVAMDRFFDQYERWLDGRGQGHSPANIREWALTAYRPAPAPAKLELIDPVYVVSVGKPVTLTLRARNLSNADWQFKPGTASAIHVRVQAYHESKQVFEDRAGMREATVPPGHSIDLALPFTAFAKPGIYRVNVDLADRNIAFSQLGSEPLMFEFDVRDH